MPIVRSDVMPLLEAGLRVDFMNAYRRRSDEGLVGQIATVVQTTLPTQKYGWLGSAPLMREFIDERLPAGLRSANYSITDKTFEATIAVDRKALEDDQYGMIRMRARDLAREAARHREQTVIEALVTGTTSAGIGYDGKQLFDTTHSEGDSGTQSNRASAALSASALQDAASAMMQFKDDRGAIMGIRPDTLVVGPALQWTARELVESEVVVVKGAGTQYSPYKNVLQGKFRLIVAPYLIGSAQNYWFLLDTSREMRAIIVQERRDVPIEFLALDAANSDSAFMRDRYLFGARSRYGCGFGLWQTAYAGIN